MTTLILDPLFDFVSIRKSTIHGFGLFARYNFASDTHLGLVMVKKDQATDFLAHLVEGYGEQAYDQWLRVVGARFINHHPNGNVRMELINGQIVAFTNRQILAGEELTTNYQYIYSQIDLVIPEFVA